MSNSPDYTVEKKPRQYLFTFHRRAYLYGFRFTEGELRGQRAAIKFQSTIVMAGDLVTVTSDTGFGYGIEPVYSIQDNMRPSAEPNAASNAKRIAGGMFIEMSTLMMIKVAINEGFKEINTLETKLFPREVGIQKVRNSFHALHQIFPQEKIEVTR